MSEDLILPYEINAEGWRQAAIAWRVCASVHEKWAKGKDGVYKTRHADFEMHAEEAMKEYREALLRDDDLSQAVEQILDAGHMNTEDLARLRAAYERS